MISKIYPYIRFALEEASGNILYYFFGMTRSGINPKTSRSWVDRTTTALHGYAFLNVTKCINLYKNTFATHWLICLSNVISFP